MPSNRQSISATVASGATGANGPAHASGRSRIKQKGKNQLASVLPKPTIAAPSFLVMNQKQGKPSRLYLKCNDLLSTGRVFVNGIVCAKYSIKGGGIVTAALKFYDHPRGGFSGSTGETTITITVDNGSGTPVSDPITVQVYVDDDADP